MALVIPYDVAVGPASIGPSQPLTLFDSWSLSRNIDDGCTLSFSCPGDAAESLYVDELANDVWLYLDGVLEQRFRITSTTFAWSPDGSASLSVQAVCYRRLLASRFLNTDLSFTATSQGDIVWDLIQHTQALPGGNLGITVGDLGPTVLRDREYVAGSNILELIVDLSQVEDGLAWDINEDLELFVTLPNLYPIRSQPLILGVNANDLSRPSNASQFGNVILVSGNTQATTLVIEEDPNVGTDPRGRWERKVSVTQEANQAALQEAAVGLLEQARSPLSSWTARMDVDRYFYDSTYGLGDFITIVVPDNRPNSPLPQTVDAQVVALAITADASGSVEVTISAVETVFPEFPSVATFPITDITTSTATFNGNLASEGDFPVTAQGFVYGPNLDPILGGGGVVDVPSTVGVGLYSEGVTGLTPGTTYYVRAYATSAVGTAYGINIRLDTNP